MKVIKLDDQVCVSGQICARDLATLADEGIDILICNRPDGEAEDQTPFSKIKAAAEKVGLRAVNISFCSHLTPALIEGFAVVMASGKKIHAYCRSGQRSTKLYNDALNLISEQESKDSSDRPTRPQAHSDSQTTFDGQRFDIVIIGAGTGGIAASASLLKRDKTLRIVIIDPSEHHYYQPGWTMVGGGIFSAQSTQRNTASLIDPRVHHIRDAVTKIHAQDNSVRTAKGLTLHYEHLIVSPGLVIDWGAIEGLPESLGKNGVTSNYRYDLAPYTWEMVQKTTKGRAIFTQPPMPIKCAGAPQKAMYLSADYWFKRGVLSDIELEFCNAGGVLFGVSDYVPALMSYIKKYNARLSFQHNLVKVDGDTKTAWFEVTDADGNKTQLSKSFDMLHVCPPQIAPPLISASDLGDAAGWLDVKPDTLQHSRHDNIWGLGDVINAANAKTMAAVRKQVPIVAHNICAARQNRTPEAAYDGYGSCPLTVERGKIVLAEFCYGGRLAPTFPTWLINGTKPTRLAWLLKAVVLPLVYWKGMLKGHEWMTKPSLNDSDTD